jgi:hypothetical protein
MLIAVLGGGGDHLLIPFRHQQREQQRAINGMAAGVPASGFCPSGFRLLIL